MERRQEPPDRYLCSVGSMECGLAPVRPVGGCAGGLCAFKDRCGCSVENARRGREWEWEWPCRKERGEAWAGGAVEQRGQSTGWRALWEACHTPGGILGARLGRRRENDSQGPGSTRLDGW